MKGNKVLILGVICLTMFTAVLAGCSNQKNDSSASNNASNTPSTSDASASDTDVKETPKLTFWSYYPERVKSDSPGVTAVKEKFGVDVEFVPTTGDSYQEKLNLMIASGDIPDWMKEPKPAEYEKYIQQGVAAEIPQELIEKYMPKYMEWIKRFIDKDDPFKYVKRDGKIYGLPGVWDLGIDGLQLGFRQDWLNKAGIAKIPETIEEMEAALTKFRNDDPDGNGKKDTYGITGTAESLSGMFSSVFGAYDAFPGIFREKEGKVVRGEIEPGAKQALEVLNRWYKNELIDPEFVVNKGNNFEDKMLTGKAGAGEFYWWVFIPGSAFLGGETWYDKLHKDNADFNWLTTGGVKGPEGKFGISQSPAGSGTGLMFGKQLEKDQDKLAKYLQIFEATQFDPEIYELLNFGVKGTHWNLNDKGIVEHIKPYDDQKEKDKLGIAGGYSMAGSFNDYDFQTSYTSDKSLRQLAKDTRAKGTQIYDILSAYQKPVLNEYQDRLTQFTLQNYIDFITGRKPLSEFDKYVEEWKKMGGDKVMQEAEQLYDQNK
ncbi:extracellular solute-binding protein [Paenibacillus sp. LHD-38]|uniref:extracellular solute-binding protein n=1 Tax=Paenibacillus sp. LHD-38 TaxID=3072143 RepID=UPI00280C4F7B|nr:extracellular solute-binding protein [Paenibacillus sp. LHD-38]MDQ8738774.1 extracellular solute-binding protein [Paenibacillus sp. LHD-38]